MVGVVKSDLLTTFRRPSLVSRSSARSKQAVVYGGRSLCIESGVSAHREDKFEQSRLLLL